MTGLEPATLGTTINAPQMLYVRNPRDYMNLCTVSQAHFAVKDNPDTNHGTHPKRLLRLRKSARFEVVARRR